MSAISPLSRRIWTLEIKNKDQNDLFNPIINLIVSPRLTRILLAD